MKSLEIKHTTSAKQLDAKVFFILLNHSNIPNLSTFWKLLIGQLVQKSSLVAGGHRILKINPWTRKQK